MALFGGSSKKHEDWVRSSIQECRSELETQIRELATELRGNVAELARTEATNKAQATLSVEEALIRQEARQRVAFSHVEQQVKMLMDTIEAMHTSLDTVGADIVTLRQHQNLASTRLQSSIDDTRAELCATANERWTETGVRFLGLESKLEDSLKILRNELAECRESSQADLHGELKSITELRASDEARRDQERKEQEMHFERITALEKRLSEVAEHAEETLDKAITTVEDTAASLSDLRSQVSEGLDAADQKARRFAKSILELEGASNNHIEWCFDLGNEVLRQERTWYSQEFEAGGIVGLRLKFTAEGANKDGRSDCEVELICSEKGFNVECELSFGEYKKRLCHTFEDDGDGSCKVLGRVVSGSGMVQVGLEIHEAHRALPIKSDDAPDPCVNGNVVAHRHVMHRSLKDMRQKEQHLESAIANCADHEGVLNTFQKHIDRHRKCEASVADHTERLNALPGERAEFEQRWAEFQEEVRGVYQQQQERLLEALDVEKHLVQMADAMRIDLTTALALRGRGPPKVAPMLPEKPQTPPGMGWRGLRKIQAARHLMLEPVSPVPSIAIGAAAKGQ